MQGLFARRPSKFICLNLDTKTGQQSPSGQDGRNTNEKDLNSFDTKSKITERHLLKKYKKITIIK